MQNIKVSSFFGLTAHQEIGIAIAIVSLIPVLIISTILITKKCAAACQNFRYKNQDTQGLVIASPEEEEVEESDPEDREDST